MCIRVLFLLMYIPMWGHLFFLVETDLSVSHDTISIAGKNVLQTAMCNS